MPKVTLSTAKVHLRVDGDDEDALIASWLSAAYLAIEGQIFRRVHDTAVPPEDETGIVANEAINASALLILGHLYANREAVTQGQTGQPVEVPMGAAWLLMPYVHTSGGF